MEGESPHLDGVGGGVVANLTQTPGAGQRPEMRRDTVVKRSRRQLDRRSEGMKRNEIKKKNENEM